MGNLERYTRRTYPKGHDTTEDHGTDLKLLDCCNKSSDLILSLIKRLLRHTQHVLN